jgi:hypothetical protein
MNPLIRLRSRALISDKIAWPRFRSTFLTASSTSTGFMIEYESADPPQPELTWTILLDDSAY